MQRFCIFVSFFLLVQDSQHCLDPSGVNVSKSLYLETRVRIQKAKQANYKDSKHHRSKQRPEQQRAQRLAERKWSNVELLRDQVSRSGVSSSSNSPDSHVVELFVSHPGDLSLNSDDILITLPVTCHGIRLKKTSKL